METIKCKVVADKVWHSTQNRYLVEGDEVEFPAEVKNHEGKLVPFKVGPSFVRVNDKPKKGGKPAADDKPAEESGELV